MIIREHANEVEDFVCESCGCVHETQFTIYTILGIECCDECIHLMEDYFVYRDREVE